MSLSAFGENAANNRGLVTRLKAGRSPSLKQARKLYKFMAEWEKENVQT